ncbi:unnamed protein product [Owenia fusiformis]|uniref:Uncharacterized protein n=1 Tax=Owenia fusiformis TaxID=6347 RepID=A0A8S4PE76_OWEFU|nr:unnamed protein product [Owenia fusiformis]
MGCGSSKAVKTDSVASIGDPTCNRTVSNERLIEVNANNEADTKANTVKTKANVEGDTENVNTNIDVNTENQTDIGAGTPSPRKGGIVFEVSFEKTSKIIAHNPPKRLQKLAPLAHVPKLTAEMLIEKQQQVEEKRKQELQQKVEKSRKMSKRQKDLLKAKEFEKAQHQYIEVEGKLKSAGKNREQRHAEIIEKQKRREERAKRARERVQKLKEADTQDLEYEVEKDDGFNKDDDVDSWLDGGNNNDKSLDSGVSSAEHGDRLDSGTERIYSGRESPHKKLNPRSSAEMRARGSASTVDSFDNAFMRPGSPVKITKGTNDDFFDS